MHTRSTIRFAAPAMALSLLFAAACGDSDDSSSTATTQAGGSAGGDVAAFCEGYTVLEALASGEVTGDPEVATRQVRENAPDELADDIEVLLAELQKMQQEEGGGEGEGGGSEGGATSSTAAEGPSGFAGQQEPPATTPGGGSEGTATTATTGAGPASTEGGGQGGGQGQGEDEGEGGGGPPSPEFLASSASVGEFAARNCADEQLEVTARDYEFAGIPATLTAGEYGVLLTNEGQEWHEIILLKKNEGVTETAEELLALPEEEAMSKVTEVGGAFAGPGTTSGMVVELDEGDYIAICFIPVGTTSLESEAEGPPHAAEGMVHEFNVTA